MEEGPHSFFDKWRGRWPEWGLAEVFVPRDRREVTLAWLALRQELLDAAWGGSDPRPGEAKLGWWADELGAWRQGMRRHPLGSVLQACDAPWGMLAAALPLLAATREQPAMARLRPIADAMAAVAAALEPGAPVPDWEPVAHGLQAQRLLGGEGDAMRRAEAATLLRQWHRAAAAPLSMRLFDAVLCARLRIRAAGGEGPPARLRTVFGAWSAARAT